MTKDAGVLSEFIRDGKWVVPASYDATAILGSGIVDLRHAEFTSPVTTITINTWLGSVDVIVPEGVDVETGGTGILGGFKQARLSPAATPAAHRIVITGSAIVGSVNVVREVSPKLQRKLDKRN